MIDHLKNIPLTSILTFDIETAPQYPNPLNLSPSLQEEFFKKHKGKKLEIWEEEEFKAKYFGKAGLSSEWGRIVCISVAAFDSKGKIKTKSYFDEDERGLLEEFGRVVERVEYLAGHNILGFDIPFVARRMILNGIRPPHKLNIFGKKPWDLKYTIDTMTLWGGTSMGYKVSLNLLAQSFNLPSPKEDINGADVGRVYWEGGLQRIVEYCERDTNTTAQLVKILKGG